MIVFSYVHARTLLYFFINHLYLFSICLFTNFLPDFLSMLLLISAAKSSFIPKSFISSLEVFYFSPLVFWLLLLMFLSTFPISIVVCKNFFWFSLHLSCTISHSSSIFYQVFSFLSSFSLFSLITVYFPV